LIAQIDAGGQLILNLLNEVLDYSRIDAGKLTLSLVPTDVGALLDGIVKLFASRARDSRTRLSVRCDLRLALMQDEMRLRQIMTNLIANAIKRSPSGEVHVIATHADGALHMEVIDTGEVLDKETKSHIFVPHQQEADLVAGLGLAICHGLVKLMGGEIGVRDTPGGGATFWFNIPAPEPAQGPASLAAE